MRNSVVALGPVLGTISEWPAFWTYVVCGCRFLRERISCKTGLVASACGESVGKTVYAMSKINNRRTIEKSRCYITQDGSYNGKDMALLFAAELSLFASRLYHWLFVISLTIVPYGTVLLRANTTKIEYMYHCTDFAWNKRLIVYVLWRIQPRSGDVHSRSAHVRVRMYAVMLEIGRACTWYWWLMCITSCAYRLHVHEDVLAGVQGRDASVLRSLARSSQRRLVQQAQRPHLRRQAQPAEGHVQVSLTPRVQGHCRHLPQPPPQPPPPVVWVRWGRGRHEAGVDCIYIHNTSRWLSVFR